MAARFIVALALVATCHTSPVLISGVQTRDGRSYSIGQGYSSGFGSNQASANVNNGVAQAFGSNSNGGNYVRDAFGNLYPGQVLAKAETIDGPENAGIEIAKAQALANNGAYYPLPAPANVISYNQNFGTPVEIIYEPQGQIAAQSVATSDGISDSSSSIATSNGAGNAESTAQTQRGVGNYGVTSTNAKTYGGLGSAVSNANTNGYGTASSSAQTNGIAAPIITEEIVPSVIVAKDQGYRTVYTPVSYDSASSSAKVHGHGSATSSAKTGPPQRRSIHWHFGTAYDIPAGYAKAAANAHNYGSANANADVNGAGSAKSTANTNGLGYANANANINNAGYSVFRSEPVVAIGYGNAKTSANTHGHGSANANVNNAGFGSLKSTANSNGYGSADANSDIDNTFGAIRSVANSRGQGSALSSANTGLGYGAAKSGIGSWGGNAVTNAQSSGYGSANSSVKSQGVNTAYRVVNTAANSSGWGNARANAQSL